MHKSGQGNSTPLPTENVVYAPLGNQTNEILTPLASFQQGRCQMCRRPREPRSAKQQAGTCARQIKRRKGISVAYSAKDGPDQINGSGVQISRTATSTVRLATSASVLLRLRPHLFIRHASDVLHESQLMFHKFGAQCEVQSLSCNRIHSDRPIQSRGERLRRTAMYCRVELNNKRPAE